MYVTVLLAESPLTLTDESFIEENHEYKAKQKAEQKKQPPNLGGFSQDMMSFWGKLLASIQNIMLNA